MTERPLRGCCKVISAYNPIGVGVFASLCAREGLRWKVARYGSSQKAAFGFGEDWVLGGRRFASRLSHSERSGGNCIFCSWFRRYRRHCRVRIRSIELELKCKANDVSIQRVQQVQQVQQWAAQEQAFYLCSLQALQGLVVVLLWRRLCDRRFVASHVLPSLVHSAEAP